MIADRWQVTQAEVDRRYPCDDLLPRPTIRAWRGVTIRAPREVVWPWVTQIRLAPYSYDWIDNLGRRSPQQLRGLADPEVGDPFTAVAGRPMGRVDAVEPGEHLTGTIIGAVMSYVLVDARDGTRLLLKIVADVPRPFRSIVSLGDLVMARRQLLNLARLAESGGVDQDVGGHRTD